MASTEGPTRPHDRHARRRPFANWMKRLANLRTLHLEPSPGLNGRRTNIPMTLKARKRSVSSNNNHPYSHSPRIEPQSNSGVSSYSHVSNATPLSQSKHSVSISHDSQIYPRSKAPTLATTAETNTSDVAHSGAATSVTAPRTEGDRNSTFSSPAHSLRSMCTTLTTVQSIAAPGGNVQHAAPTHATPTTSIPQYTGPPATAVPAHLAPHSQPTTYQIATANNVLSDDASILTLASSSKRRRRNSLDTNASVKALAPASMFGGSRESLPLSVLSGTIIHMPASTGVGGGDAASLRETSSTTTYPRSAFNPERASLISASGITAPALASERNSYIGSRYGADSVSVRSGFLGTTGPHGRNDSVSGSIGGRDYRDRERDREGANITPTSPLADTPYPSNPPVVPEKDYPIMNNKPKTSRRGPEPFDS